MKTTLTKMQTGILGFGLLCATGQFSHGSLADWRNQVSNIGAPPTTTNFTTVSGTAPLLFDVGALSGDRTFEFIVNAGLAGVSGAFLGNRQANGNQGLKFDQFPDSGVYGITNFGVVDLYSDDMVSPNVDTHVVFVSDGTSGTDLYVNGANVFSFAGFPLAMVGNQGLAGVAELNGSFSDLLDGNILGFASYDVALTPAEIATHSNAFFVPEPSTVAILGLAGLSLFSRRRGRR